LNGAIALCLGACLDQGFTAGVEGRVRITCDIGPSLAVDRLPFGARQACGYGGHRCRQRLLKLTQLTFAFNEISPGLPTSVGAFDHGQFLGHVDGKEEVSAFSAA
jgi:hypothetical protein